MFVSVTFLGPVKKGEARSPDMITSSDLPTAIASLLTVKAAGRPLDAGIGLSGRTARQRGVYLIWSLESSMP